RIPYNLIYLVQTPSGLGNCDANDWFYCSFYRWSGRCDGPVGVTVFCSAEGSAGVCGASWPLSGARPRRNRGRHPGGSAAGNTPHQGGPGNGVTTVDG